MKLQFMMTLLSLLCVLDGPAQDIAPETPKKKKGTFETGANLYSFTTRPGNFYTRYEPIYDNQFFSGLYLKYHIKKNALRWELNYSQRNFRYKNGAYGTINGQLPVRSLEIKTGYQRTFIDKRFSLYGFADLEYNYFRTYPRYNSYPANYERMDMLYPPYLEGYLISGSYFCITPGIGLRWKIGNHLSLGFESAAQFFYASERNQYYIPTGRERNRSFGINAKPARISIGFIF